jgi:DNA-binding IclR family transcriptional regulator
MAVSGSDDSWLQRQRWREERMRYEVLAAIYRGCEGKAGCTLVVSAFAEKLGIWREELFRVLEFLDRKGFIVYHGAGPLVSITKVGIDYVERLGGRRKSIRG